MKKLPVLRNSAVFSLLFLFTGFFFNSCSNSSESSFMSNMETVDIFMKNGDMNEAMKLLKKSEKKAFSSFAKIGIFRRYMIMGEEKRAENVLVKGLKKLPENPELSAVYGHFLLRHSRLEEAINITNNLEGTKYGSIRSEAVLKQLELSELSERNSRMLSRDFASTYYDMYVSTNNPCWLRNCTILYLLNGDYSMASSLQRNLQNSEDALFWAYVQYDSGNYDIAAQNLESVTSPLLKGSASLLASDAYMMLDDEESAETKREYYINFAKREGLKISPSILVNSSLYSFRHEQYRKSYEYLLEAIIAEPDFIPALITYGKLSWQDSKPLQMTELEKALRQTSLRTSKMREYDERPKFTISDALYRMEETLERESKANIRHNEDLIVERLALFLKNTPELNLTQKTAAIWKELEQNQLGTNLYPAHLVQFAVQSFLSYGLTDEGRELFMNYINAKFNLNYRKQSEEAGTKTNIKTDIFGGELKEKVPVIPESVARLAFGDRAADKTDKMEIWEVEFAAYFSLLEKNISAAKRLYEYVVFETGGVKRANAAGNITSISPLAASSSAANLAMIYSSTGESQKAMELYSLAAGKTKAKQVKSKLLYRLAKIQKETGDIDGAKTSVRYSLSLDQSNADARLLKRQIDAK
ncbi:tetratricopeptide repeat protein [Treponema sp.]|uniref:tetratricopeptide repeat protein n=1 Tax=Treponema sp. TaxID=166 RepID=UPI00388FE96E